MANLLFKKGLHKNLPSTYTEGTVYVTTDEKCMYLDVSNSERIRIQGSVLYYSTLQEFYANEKPPYSTDVIYFIEKNQKIDENGNVVSGEYVDLNALMRWNGSTWVQLNATADSVQGAITALQSSIGENAENIKDLQELTDSLKDRTSDLETIVNGRDADEAAGTEAVVGLVEKVAANANAAEKAQEDVDALETLVDEALNGKPADETAGTDAVKGIYERLNSTEEDIKDLQDTVAVKTDISGLQGQINAINEELGDPTTAEGSVWANIESNIGRIVDLEAALGTGEGTDSITSRVVKLEEGLGDLNDALSDYKTEVGETYATKEELTNHANTAASTYATKEELNTHSSTAASTYATKDELNTAKGTLEESIGDVSDALDNYKTEVSTTYATKEELTNHSNTAASTYATKEELTNHSNTAASTYATKDELKTAKETLEESIGDVSDALSDYKTEVGNTYATKKALEDAEEALATRIDDHILAANAMRYLGIVNSLEALNAITDASIGDTYVVAGEGFALNDVFVYAGDLLIANGEENAETGKITAESLTWERVDTGYNEQHENKLEVDADNRIVLKNYAGEEIDAVTIASISDNLVISNNNADTISIGMQWGEF